MSETYFVIIKSPGTHNIPWADPDDYLIVFQDEIAKTSRPYNFKPILEFARIIATHNYENRT